MSSYSDIIVGLIKSAKIELYPANPVKSQKETVGHRQGFLIKFNNNSVLGFSYTDNVKNTIGYYLNTLDLCQTFGCSLEDVKIWKKKQESIEKQRVKNINEKHREEQLAQGVEKPIEPIEPTNFVWFDSKMNYLNVEYIADCFYGISEKFRKMTNQLIIKHLVTLSVEDNVEVPPEPELKTTSGKNKPKIEAIKFEVNKDSKQDKKDKKDKKAAEDTEPRVLHFDTATKRLKIKKMSDITPNDTNWVDLNYNGTTKKTTYDELAKVMSGCCGVDGCCTSYNIGEFHFDKTFDITTSRFNINEAAESISNKLNELRLIEESQPKPESKPKTSKKVVKKEILEPLEEPVVASAPEPTPEPVAPVPEQFVSIVDEILEPIEEPVKQPEPKEEPAPVSVSMGRTRGKTVKKAAKRAIKK